MQNNKSTKIARDCRQSIWKPFSRLLAISLLSTLITACTTTGSTGYRYETPYERQQRAAAYYQVLSGWGSFYNDQPSYSGAAPMRPIINVYGK
ncbi:MAG TPA: hypothetical protein VFF49_04720 [Thermodesulfobacteriota bacterium]|nr:hypothetical protein [Thermodesulfobacteriota bacterium]